MKVLNLKNLKNCRDEGTTLYGNYGLKAIKIPSGKTVFRIQKMIKSSNCLSPFNGTIGSCEIVISHNKAINFMHELKNIYQKKIDKKLGREEI